MSDDLSINLGDVEVGDYEIVDAGEYQAHVTEGELGEAGPNAKFPGSPKITWQFTIDDGQKFAGRRLSSTTTLLPHALFGFKELLLATADHHGLDPDGNINIVRDQVIDKVIGAPCTIVVRVRKWEGEDVNNIRRVKPPKKEGSKKASSMMP